MLAFLNCGEIVKNPIVEPFMTANSRYEKFSSLADSRAASIRESLPMDQIFLSCSFGGNLPK